MGVKQAEFRPQQQVLSWPQLAAPLPRGALSHGPLVSANAAVRTHSTRQRDNVPYTSWVLQAGKEHAVASCGTMVPLGGRKGVSV